jgi:hypothetical protein
MVGGSTGAGGAAVSPGFATNLEIGGRIVVRTFGVPSVVLALGLSINETVSILLGLAFSSLFSERCASARPTGAAFSFAGVAVFTGLSPSFAFDSLALAGDAF